MKKTILSLLLAAALVLSLCGPMTALADDPVFALDLGSPDRDHVAVDVCTFETKDLTSAERPERPPPPISHSLARESSFSSVILRSFTRFEIPFTISKYSCSEGLKYPILSPNLSDSESFSLTVSER